MIKFNDIISIRAFRALILESTEWENLQDKTQVFNERVASTVKSRGSHCYDVGYIASKLVEQLGGNNIEKAKADFIGLIHDLGHITYGHAGEAVADSMISEYPFTEDEIAQIMEVRKLLFGEQYVEKNNVPKKPGNSQTKNICFEHNENSVLQYIIMCKRYGYEIDRDVVIGILSHSTSRYTQLPMGLEQQAVRLADKLAYINYDVDDLFTSFKDKEEEKKALEKIYMDPLLDPDGNQVKIPLPDGRELTIHEFLTQIETKDRIEILIEAAITDAKKRKQQNPSEYADYETILTGGNDLAVKIANLRKKESKEKDPAKQGEIQREILVAKRQLYERCPILYAAYEIKDRSDSFIRAGIGLSKESQIDRTRNSISSVGNTDFLNEYIYKSLATDLQAFIKSNKGLSKEDIKNKYLGSNISNEFIEFYYGYLDFKMEQDSVILNLPGNSGVVYPEIYTILNYIGVHSNTQLTMLASTLGYQKRFEQEVRPKIIALMDDDALYDKKKGIFTEEGRDARDELVSEYGAIIKLPISLEEEGLSPLSSDEMVKKLNETGYSTEIDVETEEYVSSKEFRDSASKAEANYISEFTKALQEKAEKQEEVGKKI